MELTVREALRGAAARLAGSVDSPAVDAEVLVGHVLAASRSSLFATGDRALTSPEQSALEELIERRRAGEPLQYLTGHQAFRTLDLAVGPGVLVPRPETEIVVEVALRHLGARERPLVVDVGTGSGAIALSVAVERPDADVWATEISPEAVVWAERNRAASRAANVTVVTGDLFAPLPAELRGRFDLVVANPPYLTDVQVGAAAPDVRDHEPWVALVSGPTGLEVPRRVIGEAQLWLRSGGWLVMETWPGQAEELIDVLGEGYRDAGAVADLAGSQRAVQARKP